MSRMRRTLILLPLLLAALIIPLLLASRKQKRQMGELQKLQSSLNDGDMVMTTSGLRAKVVDASYEDTIDLEIAPGVVTTWVRAAVREKLNPEADADNSTEEASTEEPTTAGPSAEPTDSSKDRTTS